jgi:hypothetical protein
VPYEALEELDLNTVRRSDSGSCEKTLVVLLLSHKQKLRALLDPFQVPL